MTQVERELVATGECFDIECAVRRDLSSPVAEFLSEMEQGQWDGGDADVTMEVDEQIDWLDWFLGACEQLADGGRLPHQNAHNQLRDGIWEFKHWDLRVSFYDTDGTGEYSPLIDRDSYSRFTTRPWPDDFLQHLRLTTAFHKDVQQHHISLAVTVRGEDLEHDRS